MLPGQPLLPLFLAGQNKRLQDLCEALRNFFDFTGRWDEWVAFEKEAEQVAISAENWRNAGWRAYDIGWVHHLRRQSAEMLECAQRLEKHWQKAGTGDRDRTIAIHMRGIAYKDAENYELAIVALKEIVGIFRNLKQENSDFAAALNDLTGVELESNDDEAAGRNYREALKIAKTVGDEEDVAYITDNLAALALKHEKWTEAQKLAIEALNLSEKIGRKELIAFSSVRLARALVQQGKKTEALSYAQRAVELFARLGIETAMIGAEKVLAECEG